jgi:hypothetical protein
MTLGSDNFLSTARSISCWSGPVFHMKKDRRVASSWGVEGHGVDPDILVIDDPTLLARGADPQLDAAIELMRSEIESRGYRPGARPADPDRSGMGLRDEDK